MSKTRKERPSTGRNADERPVIPLRYQHLAAVAVIFLSLVIFFRENLFDGKVFVTSDNIASHSFDTYLAEAQHEGVFPLWNPYIFCGMPGYASLTITGNRWFDLSSVILNYLARGFGFLTTNSPVGIVIFFYILLGVGMYLLVIHKVQSNVAGILGSLATVYSMYIIIWIMSGHNTKVYAVSMFPYILLLVDKLRLEFRWWYVAALVLTVHILLLSTHVQMIFYLFLLVGGFLLFYGIQALLKREQWKNVARPAVAFLLAAAVAFVMDSDRYLSVLEYNPFSIRGSNPIVESLSGAATKTTGGGLDYQYATNWSWGTGEFFTIFAPSIYGFGDVEYSGPLTQRPQRLPFYFGPEPFTNAPQYMGVVVLILGFIGFWRNRKDPFVQYLGIMIVFSILVAFGREFPIVYDPMYNFFPFFNKFRVPSMILALMEMLVPILAAYGIASFLRQERGNLSPVQERRWKYVLFGLGALFVIGLVARGVFAGVYEMFFPRSEVGPLLLARQFPRQVIDQLYDFIAGMVATDVTVGLAMLLMAFGSIYLYLRRSIKLSTVTVLVGLAIVIDLWRVDAKAMHPEDKQLQQNEFAVPPSIQAIRQMEGISDADTSQQLNQFRVLEFENGGPSISNKFAYWKIQSAFGYQGAKMRRYQDLLDVVGFQNPALWEIMNIKYLITDRPDSSQWLALRYSRPGELVYLNRLALPRAFFVNRYEATGDAAMLRAMSSPAFNPRDVAYLSEDPGQKIDPPLQDAEATMTRYGIQDFTMNVRASGTNLLFFSESWYPKGWKAFLDDAEIPIYRADYHFRAVIVPAGTHSLRMEFAPVGFSVGKNASLGANIIVLSLLGYLGWDRWRKRTKT